MGKGEEEEGEEEGVKREGEQKYSVFYRKAHFFRPLRGAGGFSFLFIQLNLRCSISPYFNSVFKRSGNS